MKELMIDIETLGTTTDAVVISVGAVLFDLQSGKCDGWFYSVVDIEEQQRRGRLISPKTVQWWAGQSPEARAVRFMPTDYVSEMLTALGLFIEDHCRTQPFNVWAKGPHFDIAIMEDLYLQYGVEIPWDFRNVMDLRTFQRFNAPDAVIEQVGTAHNALDDARSQARFVIEHTRKNRP